MKKSFADFLEKAAQIVEFHRSQYHEVYYMKGGWNPIRDAVESVASLAGNYELPGSSLLTDRLVSKGSQAQLGSLPGQIAQFGTGLAGSGGFGNNLQSAGGAAEQSGLSSLYNSAGDALSSFGDSTGLSGVGNNISNGLSNFSDSSGLSSLFGGTPQSADALNADYAGINSGAGASQELANSVATPGPSLSANSALPSGGSTLGTVGGGTLSGGGIDPSIGESLSAPSATGIGSNAADFSSSPATNGTFSGGFNFDLNGNPAQSVGTSGFDGVGGTQGGSAISNAFNNAIGTPNVPAGNFNYDLSGNPVGASALSTSSPNYAPTVANQGGNGMGTLSSLFGSGASKAAPSASSNITNALLKGGLGYFLNSPNTSGTNAINSATQAAQANYAPYLAAGNGAEKTLSDLYGNNGTGAQSTAFQNFQNNPGYQFALKQGLDAVNANAAAMGSPLSGNNQTAINNYAQGTASQTYNNYINQLQNLASGGMSAAGGSGTAGLTGAAAVAQQGQNNANAKNTAVGTGLSALFPSGLNLEQLLGAKNSANAPSGLLSLFQ